VITAVAGGPRGEAEAGTVTFTLMVDPSSQTFHVQADASLDDNTGLAGFAVDLVNIDSARNAAPRMNADSGDPADVRGFTLGNLDLAGDGTLFSGQNNSLPTTLLFGIGQSAGGLDTGVAPSVGIPWDVPVLLGTGNYSGGLLPAFGANIAANLFDMGADETLATVSAAQVATNVVVIPEPATYILILLGILGLGFQVRWGR
jgi:hypothetical protein